MNKYLIAFLFFNCLWSQLHENKIQNRIINRIEDRQYLNVIRNNYRNEEDLIQFIESIVHTRQIPGLSISIVKNENIVWEKQFGFANINDGIEVNEKEAEKYPFKQEIMPTTDAYLNDGTVVDW